MGLMVGWMRLMGGGGKAKGLDLDLMVGLRRIRERGTR